MIDWQRPWPQEQKYKFFPMGGTRIYEVGAAKGQGWKNMGGGKRKLLLSGLSAEKN